MEFHGWSLITSESLVKMLLFKSVLQEDKLSANPVHLVSLSTMPDSRQAYAARHRAHLSTNPSLSIDSWL